VHFYLLSETPQRCRLQEKLYTRGYASKDNHPFWKERSHCLSEHISTPQIFTVGTIVTRNWAAALRKVTRRANTGNIRPCAKFRFGATKEITTVTANGTRLLVRQHIISLLPLRYKNIRGQATTASNAEWAWKSLLRPFSCNCKYARWSINELSNGELMGVRRRTLWSKSRTTTAPGKVSPHSHHCNQSRASLERPYVVVPWHCVIINTWKRFWSGAPKSVQEANNSFKHMAVLSTFYRSTGWPQKMRTHILFDKKPIF